MKNPKAESRKPKEIRSPKSEWATNGTALSAESAFCLCCEDHSNGVLLLKEGGPDSPPQELLERTALFAGAVIRFAKQVPRGPVTNRLIDQVVGAASSIAANFCEADDSVSGKDFKKSIGICRKESKETMLFLRLIATADGDLAAEARTLWREAKELNLIFGSIWRK